MLGRRVDRASIKRDFIYPRLDLCAQLGDHFAVDPDAPIFNPHFTRSAGPDPGLSEPLLQTHGRDGGRF